MRRIAYDLWWNLLLRIRKKKRIVGFYKHSLLDLNAWIQGTHVLVQWVCYRAEKAKKA